MRPGDLKMTSRYTLYLTVVGFVLVSLPGCTPWYIHIPSHLQDSPLQEDVRRELRWIPHLGRIAPAGRAPQESRDLVLFPRDSGTPGLKGGGERTATILEAADWLEKNESGTVLIIVPEGDEPRTNEAQQAREKNANISVIALHMDRDAEQGASALQRAITAADPVAGVIILSGATGIPLVVEYILRESDTRPVISELLFEAHGRDLHRAGMQISGALVSDIAKTLRNVDKTINIDEEIYMLYRFVRY